MTIDTSEYDIICARLTCVKKVVDELITSFTILNDKVTTFIEMSKSLEIKREKTDEH